MEGKLLATARPYLEFFSLLSLTPPPSSYKLIRSCTQWMLLMFIFSCYNCCICVLSVYVCYVNIMILVVEVQELAVEDFTTALGIAQKIFYIFIMVANSMFILIYYRRLGNIYAELSALELEIDGNLQTLDSQRISGKFQTYLFKRLGLWILFVLFGVPPCSYTALTHYMTLRDKIFTEIIMVILQFKIIEYTLFVMLIQKILLRLRHKLLGLQRDLRANNQDSHLQTQCEALRKSKHLLARIWKLVDELEAYFWLPMLLIFLYNGLCILHLVNWAFILANNDGYYRYYGRIGHLIILLIDLLIPCWISHRCIDTYNSFGRVLRNIHCSCGLLVPESLKMILMEYTLQFEHLKLRFSCGRLFDINLEYFAGMIVSIISYMVFLIQFKMQAKKDVKQI